MEQFQRGIFGLNLSLKYYQLMYERDDGDNTSHSYFLATSMSLFKSGGVDGAVNEDGSVIGTPKA